MFVREPYTKILKRIIIIIIAKIDVEFYKVIYCSEVFEVFSKCTLTFRENLLIARI